MAAHVGAGIRVGHMTSSATPPRCRSSDLAVVDPPSDGFPVSPCSAAEVLLQSGNERAVCVSAGAQRCRKDTALHEGNVSVCLP